MKITTAEKDKIKKIKELKTGEVFFYDGKYFMKTNRSQGAYPICVNLVDGIINDLYDEYEVMYCPWVELIV